MTTNCSICLQLYALPHPQPNFLDDGRSELARELELRVAQTSALADMLRTVLQAFPELRTSMSTPQQQQVLRHASALLVEVGL